MLAASSQAAVGQPLAIELSLVAGVHSSSPGPPRLKARLMRPGARGGWVNGSLSWGSLEPWSLHGEHYREDHVALARRFDAAHQAHEASSSHYYYYSSGDQRTIDLTDWDGMQLWPLLDQAARLGVVLVQGSRGGLEIPRYRSGELVLDVSRQDADSARVFPKLRLDPPGELDGYGVLQFLGANGHGLLLTQRGDDGTSDPPLGQRRLRLVRLARETPPELQRMVTEGTGLRVPREQLPRFASELAPALRNIAPVVSADGSFSVPEVSTPELLLRARYGEDHITEVGWEWAYEVGERLLSFPLGTDSGAGLRDMAAEQAILDKLELSDTGLSDLGLLDGSGRPARAPESLHGFDTVWLATEALPALAQRGGLRVETEGEPLDYHSVDESLQIGVATIEIEGERDWFDLGVTITIDGRELPFADVLTALAEGETRMLLDDGAYFSLDSPRLSALRELLEEARTLGDVSTLGTLKISRYQASLWEELVKLGVVRRQAESWRRQVEGLLQLEQLDPVELPSGLQATPRPYQREGYEWLATLYQLGLGGILADDMGLGKTLEALALICHVCDQRRADAGPGGAVAGPGGAVAAPADAIAGTAGPLAGSPAAAFLVVAPTSVVATWVSEAERFTPRLRVRALTDTLARADVEIDQIAAEADVVVTTYTLVRLDAERYQRVEWAGVILDEAQAVKNPGAKTYAAVRRLPADFKLAMTGTPMENNLTELWALLSIVAPGLFPDPAAFGDYYAKPIERHNDSERLARLRRRIRPLVKRRSKELVAADLPPKQEQILEVGLQPRHRKLYDTYMQRERQRLLGLLDDFDKNRFTILSAITRMRLLSLHAGLVDKQHLKVRSAKLETLTEQLADVAGGGHRALVFSQFTGFLALVRARLDAAHLQYCYLDGRTRHRDKVLAEFKQGDAPVFLISLKAGGFGLNLTEADYCFLLDPWWNPAVEAQAIDRIHRIGQTRQVMVYRLVSKNTIEEKVVALAQRKAALFKGVMDDGELFAGQIDVDDIRGLLG
jgi:superfamily II DNA or RNA helicase